MEFSPPQEHHQGQAEECKSQKKSASRLRILEMSGKIHLTATTI